MVSMSLKNLKEFGKIISLCVTLDIYVAKNFETKQDLQKNIINLLSTLNINHVKNFMFIISMDFNPQQEYFSSEKSNLLFLRNKSEENCYVSIIETLSECSWDKLFYIEHILLLEHWGYISFDDITYEKNLFHRFEHLANLDDSARFEKFAKFNNLNDIEKSKNYEIYIKFDAFHVHITKVMKFKDPWKKITDREVKTLYQKEVSRRIHGFTLVNWLLYNKLIRLNKEKILFFL
jgi:hypothetical protein